MVYVNSSSSSKSKRTVKKTGKKVSAAGSGPDVDLYEVEQDGQTYPTRNPNFEPSTDPNRKIIDFNQPDNRVKVTAGGKTFDLSKEEYGGQFVTKNTIELDEILSRQTLERKGAELAKEKEGLEAGAASLMPKATEEQEQAATQLGQLTPEQEQKQAVQDGGLTQDVITTGALAGGALSGAGAGAAVGAMTGPLAPAAIPAFAAVGALIGAVSAKYGKISYQKRQDVKEAYTVFNQAKSNMGWIINEANAGRLDPVTAGNMWNEELANLNASERHLKEETKNSFQRFLSNGSDELAKIESFKRRLPILSNYMQQAILTPNPNAIPIKMEDFENEQ